MLTSTFSFEEWIIFCLDNQDLNSFGGRRLNSAYCKYFLKEVYLYHANEFNIFILKVSSIIVPLEKFQNVLLDDFSVGYEKIVWNCPLDLWFVIWKLIVLQRFHWILTFSTWAIHIFIWVRHAIRLSCLVYIYLSVFQ